VALLLAAGCLAGAAVAGPRGEEPSPPLGAYQEPAPEGQPEEHAVDFVNGILKERGGQKRVSKNELRAGVVLAAKPTSTGRSETPQPARRRQPITSPASGAANGDGQIPRIDIGPAKRAGVAAPVDQERPGMLVGLVVAALLAALGLALELAGRARKPA